MKLHDMELSFLVLKKNSKILNEYISLFDYNHSLRRKRIIEVKSKLAKLSSEQYNLLKAIATDISRFSLDYSVGNRANIIMTDTKTGIVFTATDYNTKVDNDIIFSSIDQIWFLEVLHTLKKLQYSADCAIRNQEALRQQKQEEQIRNEKLSIYGK